jgi:hypothetical protein
MPATFCVDLDCGASARIDVVPRANYILVLFDYQGVIIAVIPPCCLE